MYRINELAEMSGVSTRTLRYYDQIGLLKPETVGENGYRMYGRTQVDRLQQIMFYRVLEMPLDDIRAVLDASDFDRASVLEGHLAALLNKKEQIEALIQNVENTIRSQKEKTIMADSKKFEGFKQKLINDNEAKYGKELRERFGDDAIDASNDKVKKMSTGNWERAQVLENQIFETLKEAFESGDPSSDKAQAACDLHRQWLCMFWKDSTYSGAAHAALADGYVSDERFTAYYDKIGEGAAKFFRDAIKIYCKE